MIRGLLRSAWRRARGGQQAPSRVALAVALGLFIGSLPLYGAHFFLCLFVCLPFGLDLVVAYAAANISNPFLAPFLIVAEVELGALVLRGRWLSFDLAQARATGVLGFALEAALGSVLVGGALAALGGGAGFFVARALRSRASPRESDGGTELELAVARTTARYGSAPLAVRYYVAGKLAGDPLVAELAGLGALGRVLDAGCGRGQFGLLLLELGRVEALAGFDTDARKVDFANAAARGDARFHVRDLVSADDFDADTVLLFDVLHYLTPEEQTGLLERLSASSAARLLIRELDAVAGRASRWTRGLEWLATRTGYNRATRPLSYRSARELGAELEALGWQCRTRSASRGTPFGNVLTIATRR